MNYRLLSCLVSALCGLLAIVFSALALMEPTLERGMLFGAGFSLGAGMLLLALGRYKDKEPWKKAGEFFFFQFFNLSAVFLLAFASLKFFEPHSLFFVLSMAVASYGVVIAFFRENKWGEGASKAWNYVRTFGIWINILFLILSSATCLYDHGSQGVYCYYGFAFAIPYILVVLSYLLSAYHPLASRRLLLIGQVLLGLCPMLFIF